MGSHALVESQIIFWITDILYIYALRFHIKIGISSFSRKTKSPSDTVPQQPFFLPQSCPPHPCRSHPLVCLSFLPAPSPHPSSRELRWDSCSLSSFQISPAFSQLNRIVLTLGNKRKHLTDVLCSSFLLPFSCLEFDHSGWILSSHLVIIRQLWSLKHTLRMGKQKDRNWGVDLISESLTSPRSPTAKLPVIREKIRLTYLNHL